MRAILHVVVATLAAHASARAEVPPRRRYVLTADLGIVAYVQSSYRDVLRVFGHPAFDVGVAGGVRALWAATPAVYLGARAAFESTSAGSGGDLDGELRVNLYSATALARLRIPFGSDAWHGFSAELDLEGGLSVGEAAKDGAGQAIVGPRVAVMPAFAWRAAGGITVALRGGHQWVWWDRGVGAGLQSTFSGWTASLEIGVSP
ncbi:MAG: hypothetical protein U0325_21730 [Polyangiales bacterium]